jgi:hypothetical protein
MLYKLRKAMNGTCEWHYTWTEDGGVLPIGVNIGLFPGNHFFISIDNGVTCTPYRIVVAADGNVLFETPFNEKEWKELCFLGNHPDVLTPSQRNRLNQLLEKEKDFHRPPPESIKPLIDILPADVIQALAEWFPQDVTFVQWGPT